MSFSGTTNGRDTPHAHGATLRVVPPVTALLYPLALSALHQSAQHVAQAGNAPAKLTATLLLWLSVGLVYSVPALSLWVVARAGKDSRARRVAHLSFAAPPLFVLIGVFFYMLELPEADLVVWGIGWLSVLAFAAFAAPANKLPAVPAAWIRTAHGFSAAAIIVIFLVWHLLNHMTAAVSLDANRAIMDLLRSWYRSTFIQPLLLALIVFQLLSGLRLVWAKISQESDIYSISQTTTGAYLVVYIASHLIAVFVLGRIFLGIDTTFAWASGAPTGLLLDAWNVRLIPHYSLAVLFVISHVAMGLRTVLLARGMRMSAANRVAWILCGTGLAVSLVITFAQLRVGA